MSIVNISRGAAFTLADCDRLAALIASYQKSHREHVSDKSDEILVVLNRLQAYITEFMEKVLEDVRQYITLESDWQYIEAMTEEQPWLWGPVAKYILQRRSNVELLRFFEDLSPDSQTALALLRKAGYPFITISMSGLSGPELKAGRSTYHGLEEIIEFIKKDWEEAKAGISFEDWLAELCA